jgi:hypothetical protein
MRPYEGMQQHRACIPRRHRPAALRAAPRRAAGPGRSRLFLLFPRRLRFPGRFRRGGLVLDGPGLRLQGSLVVRLQLALHPGRAEMAQHRGLIHLQAAGDLRIAHPGRPPLPRPVPRALARLRRPTPRPDQPAGPLPQRPLVQHGVGKVADGLSVMCVS